MPVDAIADNAAASGAAQPTPDQSQQEIVVTGQAIFHDIQPERSLDQEAIESYGVSTIDDLLGELQSELGDDSGQPLIIVNGQRINDLSEIGALPVEALRDVVVLPRGSAIRAGGSSVQRVISIRLKPRTRSATLTAAHKIATGGDWNADRGEAIATSVKGNTRANIALRFRDESSLLESDRGIIEPATSVPFAIGGNIVGFPDSSGEIDPALSALAGKPVMVVPLPASGAPTLLDLASLANQQNGTDLGQFRTLRPATRNYDLNATFATQLTPWLTSSATLRVGRGVNDSLLGLPTALFILSTNNPFSPFSTDVGLALDGKQPLRLRSSHHSLEELVTLDATWGDWTGNLNMRHAETSDISHIERPTIAGTIPLDNNVDPFTTDLSQLITVGTERTSSQSRLTAADLTLTGPALQLPAGAVQATVEGRVTWNSLTSRAGNAGAFDTSFRRDEQSIRGALEIPLTSRSNNFLPQVGDFSGSLEYARTHFSDSGTVNHYTYGLTWEPRPLLRLHATVDGTSMPPPIQTLGGPVTVTPGVRIFDPLTGQTVDVTEITGGNPLLKPQKTNIRSASALLRLVPRLKLQLNAEYTDLDLRNFISSLPEASAAVTLAFPDRFVRDSNGVLTSIDLRPVNFESHRQKRLRWGLSMNAKLGGGIAGASGTRLRPSGPATYLQLTANDTIVFSDQIVIRPDLPSVDLLHGGAIGIAGGRLRHQIDGTAAITSGGIGVRMGVSWRGPSELLSRFNGVTDTLHFSPLLAINLRAFAELRRFLPHDHWARGLRLSVEVLNVTDKRQRVRDSFGNTPLQFQPALRDPLGRTIEVELRKVF